MNEGFPGLKTALEAIAAGTGSAAAASAHGPAQWLKSFAGHLQAESFTCRGEQRLHFPDGALQLRHEHWLSKGGALGARDRLPVSTLLLTSIPCNILLITEISSHKAGPQTPASRRSLAVEWAGSVSKALHVRKHRTMT